MERDARDGSVDDAVSVADLEALARARLAPAAWDYYASGAGDEVTLRGNRAAFERVALHYRVLVDVSRRELATTVLGQPVAMPVLVAPTAFHRLADPAGEAATARAAAAAGTVMILSTLSNTPVEEVVAAAGGAPVWFQLYVYKDRGATAGLIDRVAAAGCRALVLTVDAPQLGRRERDVRNRFALPAGLTIANLGAAGYGEMPEVAGASGLAAYFSSLINPALSWKDVGWLRARSSLPLVIKGIVRADDARRAVDVGADAIVVSNHGGRQLDGSPATLDVLPAVVEAVSGRLEVLFDGGVRRGTDVVKAVALGARAVLVGRPVLWGLAAGGQAGVTRALAMLRDELDLAMALCGCPTVASIGRDLVEGGATPPPPRPPAARP